ncbi:alcohol dehydrogenase 3 [Cucumis melo var. makuwa]|uniref:Alcohol dehydrogenase 3 n=1 Tax=Cucumis melo var. makuwa TaxID=1194695 RepID=A0A5D3BYZ3_CUCMM|nr:alcohol dehydrogenase 3 [Cucumis melo var. makuwa]
MIPVAAAVAWKAGKPLVIEEVEVAPPQSNEVRVKILFIALCHIDVYFWEAKAKHLSFLAYLDMKLVVESVGEGVTDLKLGDHVLPMFTGECGDCHHCRSEESNMCDLLQINTDRGVMINDGKSRFSINGKPIDHFVGTSTFSEYTIVHVGCLERSNQLCLSIEFVFSAAVAEGARIAGASRIIGVDLNPSRFEEVKKFGCNEFVNPKDHNKSVQEVIAEMTALGVGRGVAVLVGVLNKDDAFKTYPMNLLNERTLKGTFFENYKSRTAIPRVVKQYLKKELELEKFITHTVSFSKINNAFNYMMKGESIRCILRMGE